MKYYTPHFILLGVFLAALIPTLYYYQRRNPNPRFRPGFGEMLLLFVFAMAIGGPACYMMGNLFKKGVDTSQFTKPPNEGAGWSNNSSIPKEDDDEKEKKTRGKHD